MPILTLFFDSKYIYTDGETRTLTRYTHQNLNLGCLPIPPRPRLRDHHIIVMSRNQSCYSICNSMNLYILQILPIM